MGQIDVRDVQVEVINASELDDEEVKAAVKALQIQVHEHFAPAWGIDAHLNFIGGSSARICDEMIKHCKPAPGSYWLVILDYSDTAGFQGYHDVTADGIPIAKVFSKSYGQYGRKWTISASHELLEMLADPGTNLTVLKPTVSKLTDEAAGQLHTGQLYAYEVCDPCDADSYPSGVKGVDGEDILVSNFVYPAWFEEFQKPKTQQLNQQFMHVCSVNKPFELRPGGFTIVLDIPYGTGWRQIFKNFEKGKTPGYDMRYRLQPLVGSRRGRRILGTQWGGGGGIPPGPGPL